MSSVGSARNAQSGTRNVHVKLRQVECERNVIYVQFLLQTRAKKNEVEDIYIWKNSISIDLGQSRIAILGDFVKFVHTIRRMGT